MDDKMMSNVFGNCQMILELGTAVCRREWMPDDLFFWGVSVCFMSD
jgi:hypothetical protein